jgi:hypothetical protein
VWPSSIISENLDISFSRMRIVKLIFVLFGSIHIFTCAFWRVKVRDCAPWHANICTR